jgi:hypothetical protein
MYSKQNPREARGAIGDRAKEGRGAKENIGFTKTNEDV